MKITRDRTIAVLGSTMLSFATCAVIANPQGGKVVGGQATITTPNATTMDVNQASNLAAIDWRTFSVSSKETVNFLQPSKNSATLNRVLDAQGSVIDGALNAKGEVFIYNASGVLFGKEATVNVGGLLATTSNITTDDFMSGRLDFSSAAKPGAQVLNEGTISLKDGGFAALVAPTVKNSGVISGRLGKIALAAGDTFTVDLYGDQMINFAVPSGSPATRRVTQSGSLIADGGRVLLSTDAAAGVVAGVINMSGTVRADAAAQLPSGAIVLSGVNTDAQVSGTLSARGDSPGSAGGSIDLLATSVDLLPHAIVDASGSSGGGVVRVGGGFQGESGTRVADAVNIEAGSVVDVSATTSGNAGAVAVWGKNSVDIAGSIKAQGGALRGNGGMIEVSGQNSVELPGAISAAAPFGHGGTLLLDPTTITIEPTGGNSLTDPTIAGATIGSLLQQGVSVQLLATDEITVNDLIDARLPTGATGPAASGAFSLQAGTILLLKPIITNNSAVTFVSTSGDITFQADSYVVVASSSAASGLGTAGVTISSAHDVTATQIVSLGRVSITAANDVNLLQALNGLQGATGPSGIGELDVSAQGAVTSAGIDSIGNVNLAGAAGVSLSGPVYAAGTFSLSAANQGATISLAPAATSGAAGAEAVGNISIATPGTVALNSSLLSQGGSISIGTAAAPVGTAALASGTTLQAVASSTAAAQGGGISIYSVGDLTTQDLIAGSAGAIVIQSQGSVTLDKGLFGLSGATGPAGIGSLRVSASGNISANGAKVAGPLTLTSASGAVSNDGASLASSGAAVALSGASVSLAAVTDTNGAAAGSVVSGGDLTLTATAGAVEVAGGATSGGSIAINATGNVGMQGATAAQALTIMSGAAINNTVASLIATGGPLHLSGTSLNVGVVSGGTNPASLVSGADMTLASTAGAVTLGGGATAQGSLTITATGDVTTVGAQAANNLSISTAAAITNSNASLVATNGTLTLNGSSINVAAVSSAGNAALSSGGDMSLTATAGDVDLGGGAASHDNLAISASGNVSTQGAQAAQALTVNAGGAFSNATASLVSTTGPLSLTAASFNVAALPNAPNATPTAALDSGTGITITSGGTATFAGSLLARGGSASITSAGNIATSGVKASSAIDMTSTVGSITNSTAELDAGTDITLATAGAVTMNTALLAENGSIAIGSTANPVGVLTLAGDLQSVQSASSTQTGGISLFTTGNVLAPNLIAGSQGAVTIGSGGSVTLSSGLFGLGNAGSGAGIGSLTVDAPGDVSLQGALSASDIKITSGGTLQNSNATLTSTSGAIQLTGNAITLNQINVGGALKEALLAKDDISLTSPGAVTLNGEVESRTGNIEIGSDTQKIGSLTSTLAAADTAGDVLLQTDSSTARIDIKSAGAVTVSSLVAGASGAIDLVGTDVTIAGSINDATGTLGVGELAITSTGNLGIVLNDVRVSGNVHDLSIPGDSAAGTNYSLTLLSGTPTNSTMGGSIAIMGPINSGGPVWIGQSDTYQAGSSTNSQINLSNNITTSGQPVTVNGDLTLFANITRWDIECAFAGICLDNPHAVDTRLFSPGVGKSDTLGVFSIEGYSGPFYGYTTEVPNGIKQFFPPSQTATLANACHPACNLSFESYAEDDSSNPQVETYKTITCGTTCTTNTAGTMANCTPSCTETTIVYMNNDQSTAVTTTTTATGQVNLAGYTGVVAIPASQALAFAKVTAVAVDASGSPIPIYNTISASKFGVSSMSDAGIACANAFVCGITQSDFANPATAAGAATLSGDRLTAMSNLFGVLTASIDTTGSVVNTQTGVTTHNNPNGANVAITGNVDRYRGPVVHGYSDTLTESSDAVSSGTIAPTFVSSALDIDAGANTITIGGKLGDSGAATGLANVAIVTGGFGGIDPGASGLGSFAVSLTGNAVVLNNQPQQYGTGTPATDYYVSGLTVNATISCADGTATCGGNNLTRFNDLGFAYDYGNTTPAAGAFTGPSGPSPPTTGTGSTGTGGSGSSVTGVNIGGGTSIGGSVGSQGQTPSVSTIAGSGSNAIGGVGSGDGLGGLPSVTETGSGSGGETQLASTTQSTQNSDQYETPASSETTLFSVADDESSCPRGVAQLADLGMRPAYGPAPNVFSRCRR